MVEVSLVKSLEKSILFSLSEMTIFFIMKNFIVFVSEPYFASIQSFLINTIFKKMRFSVKLLDWNSLESLIDSTNRNILINLVVSLFPEAFENCIKVLTPIILIQFVLLFGNGNVRIDFLFQLCFLH